jgi:hypothetical protein
VQTEYQAVADPVAQADAACAPLKAALERRDRDDKDYADIILKVGKGEE